MADDNKPVDAGNDATDAATLKLQNDELAKKLADVEARLSGLDSLNKDLIADRDKAKEARREAERKALEEQGQFKTIAEQTQQELDRIKAEQEAIKARAEAAESQLKARDDAERAAILDSIPEANREEWKDSDLPTLRKVAPLYGQTNGKTPSKAPASGKYAAGPVDFSDMTETEQFAYARDHGMTPVQIAEARMKARNKKRQ